MSHPLEQRIAALRSRVRWLVALYGVSLVTAAVLGAVVVLGLIDYAIRFQDQGLRVICSLAVLGALGWTCYRHLYRALAARLRDVDLALRLQRRFPDLEDRLVSSVEFLHQSEDDPTAGSPALRRAVIAETAAETDWLDFSDALDLRRPLWAAMAAAAVCLVAAILLVGDLRSSRIAVVRLVNPLGATAWPQKTHLALADPVDRVARGKAFGVKVFDAEGAKLPPEIRVHYRIENPDGTETKETKPIYPMGDSVVVKRKNVIRPFRYRVEGGDDDSMAWINVEVIEPVMIESLSIQLIPPRYTGWPPEKADRHIRALVGTEMRITGKTTKPLGSAVLHLDGEEIAGSISDGGRRFTLPAPGAGKLRIEESGSYWFELTDPEGLPGGSDARWEISAVPDSPPTVSIEQPDRNLFVTSRAVVPIRLSAKDDLAIHETGLVLDRSGRPEGDQPVRDRPEQDEWTELLYARPVPPGSEKEANGSQPAGGLSGGAELGERRLVRYRLELDRYGLAPGTQLTFHATATDYRPATGKSQPRRLIVITDEELQDRIAGRQSQILAELKRVLKMQQESRSQVAALGIRHRETGRLEQLDVDHLQAAELNQRQVNRSLADPGQGVPKHVLALLGDLDNNRIDGPDIRRHMQSLLDEIDRLKRGHLPVIGRDLTAAIKAAQVRLQQPADRPAETPDKTPVGDSLTDAVGHQDEVIASLERMLGQLAQWDNYRRFHREIGQLLRDQQEVARRTAEVGRQTLTKELKDLRPQERADLKVLARRQLELARLLDRIQQEMEQTGRELQQSDPLAAETVTDALDEARRLGVSGRMRACGGHLGRNQIGQAVARQKQVARDLREVLDILANRRRHELARLVRKLTEAENELAEIQRQQAALRKQMEQNTDNPDSTGRQPELQRIGREQQELQKRTERLGRRLERLLAEQAGRTTRQAAGKMGEAGRSAGQGDNQQARQRADEVRKDLEKARRELASRRLQAQIELATEQLAGLEDALKHFHRQQKNVIDRTRQLDELRRAKGRLTRAQSAGLRNLARLQRSLQRETVGLAEKLVGAAVFNVALSGAAREMGRAAAMLDRQQTGPPTQLAAKNALGRLSLLLEALQPERPDPESADAGGGSAGASPSQGEMPGGGVQTVAEVKLLKLMQEEINRRTRELQEQVGRSDTLTDDGRRRYALLSEEQGRLADLAAQLSRVQQEQRDPLLEIARQMRRIEELIGRSDSGLTTQDLQEQVVADLDRLLEQARRRAKQSKPGAGQSQQASIRRPIGQPQSKPGDGPRPGDGPSTASSQRPAGNGPARRPDMTRMRKVMEELWGQLPPRQRQQMLQLPVEEFLPKYELLIEEYFRRLAEEKER